MNFKLDLRKSRMVRGALALAIGGLVQSGFAPQAQAASPVVKQVTVQSLKKLIASNKGKVVVLNFWATWCPPCRQEFPAFVKFQKQYAKRGVKVLFVSSDSKRNLNGVRKFIASQRPLGPTYIVDSLSSFSSNFDPADKEGFSMPRTYIYGRNGQIKRKLTDGKALTFAELQKYAKPYL